MNYLKIEKGKLLATVNQGEEVTQEEIIDGLTYFPVVIPYITDNVHVYIHCPYCQREHRHGSGGGKKVNGHRLSHCDETTPNLKKNIGYVILQEDTIVLNEQGEVFQIKDLASSYFLESGNHCDTYHNFINKINKMGKLDTYGALDMD